MGADPALGPMTRDWAALKAEGIVLDTSGLEGADGAVEIGIHDLTAAKQETLLQRYGDAFCGRDKIVVVEKVTHSLSGRQNDGPPWYQDQSPQTVTKVRLERSSSAATA